MRKLVLGEYDSVARVSCNINRLRKAHMTPCDAAMAYFLVAYMHEKYFAGSPAPILRLREPIKGKYRARGWGGMKIVKGEKRGYVSLPKTPFSGIGWPYGFLRVGLVVHEFAHAFQVLKFGKTDHSPQFTMILDMLLYETSNLWEK